jgi:heme-degrading monooxygenase HmoA
MTVKIIIDRQFKEAHRAADIRIFNDLRIGAMGQNGYISGETLVDVEDNKKIVVISVWKSIEDWETWRDSGERKKLEAELSPYLGEPAKIRAFMLGA